MIKNTNIWQIYSVSLETNIFKVCESEIQSKSKLIEPDEDIDISKTEDKDKTKTEDKDILNKINNKIDKINKMNKTRKSKG